VRAPCGLRRASARAVAAALAITACLSGCGPADDEYAPTSGPPFSPRSFWNLPLPDDARTDPASDLADRLARQTRYDDTTSPVRGYFAPGYGVNVNMADYSVPVWTVGEDQPTVPVTLVDEAGEPRPAGWAGGLPEQLRAVPLPTGVGELAADGSDGHVVVWQPSTDTYWEFWVFDTTGARGGPSALYGGRIDHVTRSGGVLPEQWGARGTSLALLGGVVRMREFADREVPHALAVAVPVISAEHLAPATRDDGPGASVAGGPAERDAVPEGARFRLPAGYDCAALPGDRPLLEVLCVAARDHGLVVVDRTGGTVSFFAEDDKTVGTPFSSVGSSPWAGVALAGPESGLTDLFPWEDLQVLRG
jgi:hypothetical protein